MQIKELWKDFILYLTRSNLIYFKSWNGLSLSYFTVGEVSLI